MWVLIPWQHNHLLHYIQLHSQLQNVSLLCVQIAVSPIILSSANHKDISKEKAIDGHESESSSCSSGHFEFEVSLLDNIPVSQPELHKQ